ncbi:MAG: HisA/HisF-related TIM barrel protein, partial [Acidimicrobiales bacterium]
WAMNSGRYLDEVLLEMSDAGVTSFLIAEAGRDALVEPPNLEILATALTSVEDDVIAAGGVRHLDDLRDIMAVSVDSKRVAGVIVGREVTHGRFAIDQAKSMLAEEPRAASPRTEAVVAEDPSPDPADVLAAERYQQLATELDRAAGHARTSAQRLLTNEPERGHAHGLMTHGHLNKAQRLLDDIAGKVAEDFSA